jgi:hypothetical protein
MGNVRDISFGEERERAGHFVIKYPGFACSFF